MSYMIFNRNTVTEIRGIQYNSECVDVRMCGVLSSEQRFYFDIRF